MLIGLCGAAGCGKTTLANELKRRGHIAYGFADPIKKMLEVFGIDEADWENREAKEAPINWLGVSPRYLAQTLGTEWGRQCINPNIWVATAAIQWQRCQEMNIADFVLTDVRFQNEAEWIHKEGGCIIKIVRKSSELQVDNPSHASEQGFEAALVDATVYNDSSVDDLYTHAWKAIEDFAEGRE